MIATVRDPSHSTSKSLTQLPSAEWSRLIILQLDAGSGVSIANAVDTLKTSHGVDSIDVVISNAGFGEVAGRLTDVPVTVIQKYMDINAYGPLELFRATLPLLGNSQTPKFCIISSLGGSNTALNLMIPTAPYNASKLVVNYFARWLAFEVPEVITWVMHPG